MKCFSVIVYYLLFERKKEQNREKFENESCTCENKSIGQFSILTVGLDLA